MAFKLCIGTLALAGAACVTTTASADWEDGQSVGILGSVTELEQKATYWGTGIADQPFHILGGQTTYFDPAYGDQATITVSSTVLSPTMLSVVIDFSDFVFLEIASYAVVLPDLKVNGTINGAISDIGFTKTDGNSVYWFASSDDVGTGSVKILITQIPAPAAAGLFGLAALAAGRRRRA